MFTNTAIIQGILPYTHSEIRISDCSHFAQTLINILRRFQQVISANSGTFLV